MRATLRTPVWVGLGLFQPVCWLLLFAPLLENLPAAPGLPRGSTLTVFLPGLLILQALGSTSFVGFGLIAELRAGVIERFRVTPVSRLALPLGWALRDVVVLLVQAILRLAVGWLLELRAHPAGVALALGLVVLIGLLQASRSYALALLLKNEDALAPTLNFFFLPALLLSGIALPLALAPAWLRAIAALNPYAYAVDAARALFSTGTAGPVVRGYAIVAALAVLSLAWVTRAFRQAAAWKPAALRRAARPAGR